MPFGSIGALALLSTFTIFALFFKNASYGKAFYFLG